MINPVTLNRVWNYAKRGLKMAPDFALGTGGEAFEGLDNAATLSSNIIILVNDNDMSIAPNSGGLYERNDGSEKRFVVFRSVPLLSAGKIRAAERSDPRGNS